MRLIWVTSEPPDRSLGGGGIRQAELLQAVGKHCDVTCLLYGDHLGDEASLEAIDSLVLVPTIDRPQLGRTRRRIEELVAAGRSANPPEINGYRGVRRVVAPALQALPRHDAMIIEHPGLAPLASLRSERRLLTLHNVASGTLAEEASMLHGRRRWLVARQAEQARQLERWCLDYFDTVFSVSARDAAMLPGPSVVVDNGVDTGRYEPSPVPREPRVSLIGTLGYSPNLDGARWFVNEVLPLVRRQVPDVQLDLVGRLPTPEVMALAAPPAINVIPEVPDIRPYYERTRVVIVPLRVGTGTRLKALEGMAASRPVVGTSIGLAGLEIEAGKHALIADEPDALARHVVAVLNDDALAARLAEAGRALVTARYSWEGVAKPFIDAVLAWDPARRA